jgi:hypothetical protein
LASLINVYIKTRKLISPNSMSLTNVIKFPDGPWTAWQPFQSQSALIAIALAIAFFVSSKVSAIIAAWPFITRRDEYMRAHNERVNGETAEFKVLHVRV